MDKRAAAVGWEAFEEKAKLAFVADAARSRLVIRTRVGGAGQQRLQVVARVAHEPREVVKYQTSEPAHVSRLVRLLRFAMQEVLGPMRAAPTVPVATVVASEASAVAQDAKPKKKKKSKKKH
jgi:hypothetical protein